MLSRLVPLEVLLAGRLTIVDALPGFIHLAAGWTEINRRLLSGTRIKRVNHILNGSIRRRCSEDVRNGLVWIIEGLKSYLTVS